MRLIVLVNAYNETKLISKCIESVHEQSDEIWLYDGAYKQYPNKEPYSTDGMLEIASRYPKVKIFGNNNQVWGSQIIKRTAMFENGQDGDMFLVLDGDEYVTNPEVLRNDLNFDVGWVWNISNLYRQPYMKARLFKYRKGMHYAGRHHWLFDGDNNLITSDQRMNLRYKHKDTPVRIFNYRDSSSPQRIEEKKVFLQNRNPDEQRYPNELSVYKKIATRTFLHAKRAGQPCKPAEIIKYSDDIQYTFTLMFSRPWAIDRYFDNLKNISLPKKTEMICVIDTDDMEFANKVVDRLKDTQFDSIKYIVTGNPKLPEFSNVAFRRQRIIDNWHILLSEARGEMILAGEDDSLPEPNAYIKLLKDIKKYNVDLVQGNIIGRWSANMYPAWKVLENRNGEPFKVMSGELKKGVEEIQGCGWYCFVCRTDTMLRFSMSQNNLLPLGPDVSFGYRLHKAGYKLLHDWDIDVEHFGETFSLYPRIDKTKIFTWVKVGKTWCIK